MLLIWSSTGSIAWTSRPLTAVLFNRAGAAEMWMLIVVMVYSTVPDLIKEYARREQEAGDPLRWRGTERLGQLPYRQCLRLR